MLSRLSPQDIANRTFGICDVRHVDNLSVNRRCDVHHVDNPSGHVVYITRIVSDLSVSILDFWGIVCYTSSIRKLEKVSKLERKYMYFVNKCSLCGYQTPELQDSICPVCSDRKSGHYVRLEEWVRVEG